MTKRFSVIIAAYNREKYIRQTIDSVFSQTFTDYEVIVVDDGSTDRTQDILQSYGERIKYVRQVNQGSEATFRRGASLATGEYLAFLDSDDLFLPCALSTYDKIFRELDSPPVIVGSLKRFMDGQDVQVDDENADVIEVLKYRDYLSKDVGIGLAQSIIVIRRSIFEVVDGVRSDTTNSYLFNYDYNLMLQVGTHGPCVIVKRPITVAYRQHENQNSLNIEKMAQGVLSLIYMVRNGECYGGKSRFLVKCAYLGGPVNEWGRKALMNQRPGLAFRLLLSGWPMVAVAILRKLWIHFFRTSTPLFIKN